MVVFRASSLPLCTRAIPTITNHHFINIVVQSPDCMVNTDYLDISAGVVSSQRKFNDELLKNGHPNLLVTSPGKRCQSCSWGEVRVGVHAAYANNGVKF